MRCSQPRIPFSTAKQSYRRQHWGKTPIKRCKPILSFVPIAWCQWWSIGCCGFRFWRCWSNWSTLQESMKDGWQREFGSKKARSFPLLHRCSLWCSCLSWFRGLWVLNSGWRNHLWRWGHQAVKWNLSTEEAHFLLGSSKSWRSSTGKSTCYE